jgi:hypothetical protein
MQNRMFDELSGFLSHTTFQGLGARGKVQAVLIENYAANIYICPTHLISIGVSD